MAQYDRKAKRLKSLLARQKALRGERRLSFITPLVFLSSPDLDPIGVARVISEPIASASGSAG